MRSSCAKYSKRGGVVANTTPELDQLRSGDERASEPRIGRRASERASDHQALKMGVTRRFNDDGSAYEEPPTVSEGSVVYLAGARLQKTVKRAGNGAIPGSGDQVQVHYVGTLEDGTVFDSSRRRKKPFSFTLGQGSVISGWEAGVGSMREGELVELKCAPEFAYGPSGMPPVIPPDATLTFEVRHSPRPSQSVTVRSPVPQADLSLPPLLSATCAGRTAGLPLAGTGGGRVQERHNARCLSGADRAAHLHDGAEEVTRRERSRTLFLKSAVHRVVVVLLFVYCTWLEEDLLAGLPTTGGLFPVELLPRPQQPGGGAAGSRR